MVRKGRRQEKRGIPRWSDPFSHKVTEGRLSDLAKGQDLEPETTVTVKTVIVTRSMGRDTKEEIPCMDSRSCILETLDPRHSTLIFQPWISFSIFRAFKSLMQ